MLADDSLDELAQMDGWTVDGERATHRPLDAGWSALVMYRTVYGKAHNRWHMSLIDPRQRCHEVSLRARLADARYLAEGRVAAENRSAQVELGRACGTRTRSPRVKAPGPNP